MRDFFSPRLSISNTFVVVFTLPHCISLKCGIFTYSSERKLYSAVSVEDIRLDIHATPNHIELQRVVLENKIIAHNAGLLLARLSISNMFLVVFTLQPCISLKCGMYTYSSKRKLYSAYSEEDTRLDVQATQVHIELQRVV